MIQWLRRILLPVPLPADERVILRKRESLRSRGIIWGMLILWIVSLFFVDLGLELARLPWSREIRIWLQPLFILLLISLLPTGLYTLLKWVAGTYILTDQEIRTSEGLAARLVREPRISLDLRQIHHVHLERPRWPGRMFDLHTIVLSTRTDPEALRIKSVERAEYVADEIKRRMRLAHATARGAHREGTGNAPAVMAIRRSGIWLLAQWIAAALVIWGMALLWLATNMAGWAPDELALTALLLEFITLISLVIGLVYGVVSFLRWWLCIYIVTDRRVIHREGLLNIKRHVLPLDQVVSATVFKTAIGDIVDVGNVQISTAGLSGSIVMRNVSAPDYVRQRILDTQEMVRRERERVQIGDISQRLSLALRL